jgi:hypothetical protein
VIFPTFWTHAHCGQIPRSEDKYIVSSFVSFAIPAASQAKGPGSRGDRHDTLARCSEAALPESV